MLKYVSFYPNTKQITMKQKIYLMIVLTPLATIMYAPQGAQAKHNIKKINTKPQQNIKQNKTPQRIPTPEAPQEIELPQQKLKLNDEFLEGFRVQPMIQ
jgi:hypothetical protein